MTSRDDGQAVSPTLDVSSLVLGALRPARTMSPDATGSLHAKEQIWRADAIHRTKNLAQMASGLSHLSSRRAGPSADSAVIAQARNLASIYEELGYAGDGSDLVPCAGILRRLLAALAELLMDGSETALQVDATELFLTHSARRALVLITSELFINALKYAFPSGASGMIYITLVAEPDGGVLIVKDDGIGLTGPPRTGEGSRLIDGMAGLLGGRWERNGRPGGGTICKVWFLLFLGDANRVNGSVRASGG